MPKAHSYQNHPIIYKLTILGQDMTSYLVAPRNIESSLDYPNLENFRVAEATFILRNDDNMFSPYNDMNFFKTNGTSESPAIQADGYRSPVRLDAGFLVNGVEQTETIFQGVILNISLNAKGSTVDVTCDDGSQPIRNEPVTDLGERKKISIEAAGEGIHGQYPFYEGLLPLSLESSTGSGGLMRKEFLNTEGPLDSANFQEVPDYGIFTEGERRSGNPVITFRAPFRDRPIEDLVQKLLTKYGITSSDIKMPIATGSTYWTSLGRPYYEPAFSDLTVSSPDTWQFPGVITDMIGHESTNTIYMLISQTGQPITIGSNQTPQPKPRVVRWNLALNQRSELFQISRGDNTVSEEAWRMAANSDFTTFYILGCEPEYIGAATGSESNYVIPGGFARGSYSSSEITTATDSKILVHQVTGAQTSPSRIDFLHTSNSGVETLRPQLACYYHLGTPNATNFELRKGNIPDSRRNFHLHSNGTLYYGFANAREFGVAKASTANTPTEVIKAYANRSYKSFNSSAFDFVIDETDSKVYFAYAQLDRPGNQSRGLIVGGDI